jgi:hypothetical protein
MSAADRNRELAADVARRAIAAAERRAIAQAGGEDAAERLRQVADADGRLTPEQALAALRNEAPSNDWIREGLGQYQQERAEHDRRTHERLFGSQPEPNESTKPQGEADGGKGDVPIPEVEYVQTERGMERMEVFDLDYLDNERNDS